MDVVLGNATDNIINIDGVGGITISGSLKNATGVTAKLTLGGAGTGV